MNKVGNMAFKRISCRQKLKTLCRNFSGGDIKLPASKKIINIESLPRLDQKILRHPIFFENNLGAELESRINKCETTLYKDYMESGTQMIYPLLDDSLELCKSTIRQQDKHPPILCKKILPNENWIAGNAENTEVKKEIEELIKQVKEDGFDYISCNQFVHLEEAKLVFDLAKSFGVPSVYLFSCDDDGKMKDGNYIADACEKLDEYGAFIVGIESTPDQVQKHTRDIRRAVGCQVGLICSYDRNETYSENMWNKLYLDFYYALGINYLGISGAPPSVVKGIAEDLKLLNMSELITEIA